MRKFIVGTLLFAGAGGGVVLSGAAMSFASGPTTQCNTNVGPNAGLGQTSVFAPSGLNTSGELQVCESGSPIVDGTVTAEGIAGSMGASLRWHYERRYPPTVNSAEETEIAAGAAAEIVGADNLVREFTPSMGSEDFAFMLQARPGCYILIGNGVSSAGLHNPHYDFNDEVLPIGASYWSRLVERVQS